MNYFFVNYQPILNDIYPQVVDISEKYAFESPNSLKNIISNEPLGFSPDINYLIVDPKLKSLTDNLSQHYIYSMGLLISGKLKELISKNGVIQECSFYDAIIYFANNYCDYYWMHIENKIEKYIDYKKSKFLLRKEDELGKYKEIIFRNVDDFTLRSKKWTDTMHYNLSIKELHFLPDFICPDLFFLHLLRHKLYISENLLKKFRKNNITGFQYNDKPFVVG